jgi:hypothetical protein
MSGSKSISPKPASFNKMLAETVMALVLLNRCSLMGKRNS